MKSGLLGALVVLTLAALMLAECPQKKTPPTPPGFSARTMYVQDIKPEPPIDPSTQELLDGVTKQLNDEAAEKVADQETLHTLYKTDQSNPQRWSSCI